MRFNVVEKNPYSTLGMRGLSAVSLIRVTHTKHNIEVSKMGIVDFIYVRAINVILIE